MSATISTTKGMRQSNIELLRIIAMFLILTVHADYWALGAPTALECISSPLASIIRITIECIAILSVNIFVLISGWFTIKPSIKGFCSFMFQCIFFFFGIYAVMICIGLAEFSVDGVKICLLLTSKNWFIKSYIGLYILSPILNCFCEKATEKQFVIFLTGFYIFQTLYGLLDAVTFINGGYSTFSFIGLYILAQYIKRYRLDSYKWRGVFILSLIFNASIAYCWTIVVGGSPGFMFNYINPLVIIGALSAVVYFSRLQLKPNRIINWVAASAFAAYLTHGNPNIGTPYFKPYIQQLYNSYSGLSCIIAIFLFLMIVFAVSILLDQPRKWCWNKIAKRLPINKI